MSDADEILKLKKLLDAGVITQEEFEREKNIILDTARERREAATAYTRSASAGKFSAGAETGGHGEERDLYSAIADEAGIKGEPASAGEKDTPLKENVRDSADDVPEKKHSLKHSAKEKRGPDDSGREPGSVSPGVRVRAVIFAIFLWPVGLFYTIRRKPFPKAVNILVAIADGFFTILLVVILTLTFLFHHYSAQLSAIHEAVTAAAGGAESSSETVSGAASEIAANAVSGETQTYEEFLSSLKTVLKNSYGNNYQINDDGTTLTISIWQDGVAKEAAYIVDGYESSDAAWENMKSSVQNLASTCFLSANASSASRHVCVNILNDQNQSNVLLSYLDGECIYDAVEKNTGASSGSTEQQ